MDAFLRRLVQRLNDPSAPLSRNRHFHTLETPEGKKALRISKRLRGLQREILDCHANGRQTRYVRYRSPLASKTRPPDEEFRIELRLEHVKGTRISILAADEFQLLSELPGVKEAIEEIVGPEAA